MKIYTIKKTRKGRSTLFTGTVAELTKSFSYTLDCGYSWNNKIKTEPKTIKSLLSSISKSYDEIEASCFERTYVELVTEGK